MASSTLPRGSFLLIFPEDVDGAVTTPVYATIKSSRGSTATLTLRNDDDDSETTLRLPMATALIRKVGRSDAEGAKLGTWIRQAVCVKHDGYYCYGQVTGYSNAGLVIYTLEGPIEACRAEICDTVYPVVALLMGCNKFPEETWSYEQLEHTHDVLMDRLLSPQTTDTPAEPLSIAQLVHGVLPEVSPGFDRLCYWTDARTGKRARISLQHVVNYVYYVDDEKRIPDSMEGSFGSSFCEVVVQPVRTQPQATTPRTRRQTSASATRSGFFDDVLEVDDSNETAADEAALAQAILDGGNENPNSDSAAPRNCLDHPRRAVTSLSTYPTYAAPAIPNSSPVAPTQLRKETTEEAEILDLIRMHKPHLLTYHMEARQTPSRATKRTATNDEDNPTTKRGKFSFTPSTEQRRVHDAITSDKHRVDSMLRLRRQRDSFINMSDFSVSAKFMPAPDPPAWEDVLSGANGFQQYCFARCDAATQHLATTLYNFVVELKGCNLWPQSMLLTLVLWIDTQLEKYRTAVVADIEHATSTKHLISSNFTSNNVELHGLLLVEQQKQVEAMRQSPGHTGPRDLGQHIVDQHTLASSIHTPSQYDSQQPVITPRCMKSKTSSSESLWNRVRRSQRGGRTSSVCETQFESLHGNPTRPHTAGRTNSVDRTQFDPLPNPLVEQQHAGYTSSVSTTQFESLLQSKSRRTSARRTVTMLSAHVSSRRQPFPDLDTVGQAQANIKQGRPTPNSNFVRDCLIKRLSTSNHASTTDSLCTRLGISPPKTFPLRDSNQQWQLNQEMQRVVSALALEHHMSLPDIVEAVRGQSNGDFRPNKAVYPSQFASMLDGYKHKDLLVQIAREGIQPTWKVASPSQTKPTKNHGSASRHLNAVLKAIRKGQDAGQYLVLDSKVLQIWKNIQISPLGAVMKKDCDPKEDVRLIHDLSFRRGTSTNDMSRNELSPEIEYKHIAAIARRILACRATHKGVLIKIMKGDVKGAFRHLMLASEHVHWMTATIPELGVLIVDMSAPFGWTSSPAFYGAFGGAITWLLSRESPASLDPCSDDQDPFFAYERVDDHVLVEPDTDNRLQLANEALRLAMMAILGSAAINEDKFSAWETKLQVLGLEFDTEACTISMPADKIAKALARVQTLQVQTHTSRTQIQQLLGSLRHVCSCLRAAKPFYQRIHAACVRAPRYGKIVVGEPIRQDLRWFAMILSKGQFQKLPLAMYSNAQPVDVHIYMDASNSGLAVLNPARKQYIQIQFDAEEQRLIQTATGGDGFNINVRELLCVALAAWGFGPEWAGRRGLLIKAWSDNTSAVSWANRLASMNPFAQEVMRAIGLAEAIFGFRVICGHLPGISNTMADVGSRAWTPPHAKIWSNLSSLWQQIPVPEPLRKVYTTFSSNFNLTHWPLDQDRSTPQHGRNGRNGVRNTTSAYGYQQTPKSTPTSLPCLQSTTGAHQQQQGENLYLPTPFCPLLATSHGIICANQDIRLASMPDTNWPCAGCSGCRHLLARSNESRSRFYERSDQNATSEQPTTACSGGLRSWFFFFLLRRSEYLADGSQVKPYIIRTMDIKFITKQGINADSLGTTAAVSVHFRGSKTDQAGSGATRTLHRSGSSWLCPVLAAWELVQIADSFGSNEALCSTAPGRVLTANTLGDAIKRAAQVIGADPTRFGTHSMRSGGATSMFTAGADRLAIKLFGRWTSDAFERYTRMNDTVANSLAHNMMQGAQSRVSPAAPEGLHPAQHSSWTR